jgi:hypothetical protein
MADRLRRGRAGLRHQDRLHYQCYCDGLPELDYLAQADGVRLSASVEVPEARSQVEDFLD